MNGTIEAVQAPAVPARLSDFLALAKPGITVMVSVTAAAGFILAAPGAVEWTLLLSTVIGTMLAAAGSAALNMVLERDLDAKMERTRNRPLPAGRLSTAEAAVFGTLLAAAGVAWLALAVNLLSAAVCAATVLSYLGIYTPMKTRTSLCTVVGAVPGALPPVLGWAAAKGSLDAGATALFLILFFWQLPHFLALAWMYRDDYARGGFAMLTTEQPDGSGAGRQVVLQTLALIVASLLPVMLRMAGDGYLVAALVLGTGFLGFGVAFAAERTRERASRLFLASIAYLPVLLGVLVLG